MTPLRPLAFIDSGVGGIPYMDDLRTRLPHAPIVYVADNLHFPYGPKTEEELRPAILAMAGRVIKRYRPELVVVACNTASMLALDDLRHEFAVDFVGVVPAVKPAAERSRTRSIGVMATERATKGAYLDRLVADFAADCQVTRVAATELIGAIERDPFMDDHVQYQRLLASIREKFLANKVDTIVLGCTHFLLLNPELLAGFGDEFSIVDSRQGVTNRTIHLLEEHGCLPAYQALRPGEAGPSYFHLTGVLGDNTVYPRVAGHFGLEFGGTL